MATDLTPDKPPLEDWRKPGASPEQRLRDSADCGGGPSARVGFTPQAVRDEKRPGESDLEPSRRLLKKWADCMVEKGYLTDSLKTPAAPSPPKPAAPPQPLIQHEPVTSRSTEPLASDKARILMRSTGMPMNVDYSISASEQSCKDFTQIGAVRDKGQKVLSSWIVKLGEKLNSVPDQIETVVPAGQPVQVAGWGNWQDSKSKGNCGPSIVSFQPAQMHTYLVEFVWQGTARCMSRVYDVTDPATRTAVPTERKYCSRSFMDVWLGRSGLSGVP